MMGQVLIRNLDDQTIASLKRRAERKGHSLEHELRDILKQAAKPTAEERLAAVERVAALQKRPSKLLSEDVIRRIRYRRV
jgi:plasmid stability protein